jgi:hypothetical protein
MKIIHDNDDIPYNAANKYLNSNGINIPIGEYISSIPHVINVIHNP